MCPSVITNVERNLLLNDNIEEAEKKHVKIITGDDLLRLINSVRTNDSITRQHMQQLLRLKNTTNFHKLSDILPK
jgi:hypothetical protein